MVAELKCLRRKVAVVQRRLVKAYGLPVRAARGDDALSALINCILSQHTSDLNSDRAFAALRARFPAWEQLRDAPLRQVREVIRPAGLANQKAPRIQAVLRAITQQRGQLNINFLRRMPVADAKQWLLALNGVGPKTAAITLLFGLNCPAFPVDTHVHRVSGRLGLIPRGMNADKAHAALEALVPERDYYAFHINLIRHGRKVCKAGRPRCEQCVLTDVCDYYQSVAGR